jgi:hypothetical protein
LSPPPSRFAPTRDENQPIALDRVALEPFEKTHAEQAFVQGAAARDHRGHVAHNDRPDRDLIEPRLRRHRRAVGGGDRNVEDEAACFDASPPRVIVGQHHRGSAGVEQKGHAHAINPAGDREFPTEEPVDDDFPATSDLRLRREKLASDATDDLRSLKAISVETGQRDQKERPSHDCGGEARNVAWPRRTQATENKPKHNSSAARRAREALMVEPKQGRLRRGHEQRSQRDRQNGNRKEEAHQFRRSRALTRPPRCARDLA